MGRLYQREKTFELRQAEAIPKNTGDFSAGFTTGWLSTKQLGAGAVAAAGDAIGNEDVRQYGVDKYKSLETQMQPYQKDRPTSVEDIKGVGSAIDWAQYQLGNLAPSMIESLGSALIGAGVGAVAGSTIGPEGTAAGGVGGFMAGLTEKALVKGYLEKQVAKMVATGVAEDVAKTQATKYVAKKAGAAVVMFGNSYIQGVGDVYGETMDANGKGNAMAAFLGAVPYAAIDTIVDMSVIGRTLSGTKGESVLRRYAAAIAADATSEGAQESGQEAILMAAGVANGQSYDTNTVISRLGNSFAAAALGGGAVGITGGHKAKVATKTDITQNKDVPFTDVPNPKAEEIFTKTIQALPEKTVNATVEGLARPMSPEMISSLSSEELQHVGIALNAAKEIPGANIQAIESNIQMIEATGNKIPTVQPAPIEIKTPATSVPVLTEKPVVATEKKVAAPVKETIASETKPAEVILQEKFDKEQLVRESENLTTAKKLQETMVKKLGEPNADLTTTIKGMEERVNSLKNKVDEASTEKKSSPRIEAARANNKIKAEKARISDREKAKIGRAHV